MNLPRYGVCDALPHPYPCLRTCIPFTHFSLGPSSKQIGSAPLPPPLWVRPCLHYDLIFIAAVAQWKMPMGKETLIITIKLHPNVIHSQLGMISVRNRISRLKKLCIIKPIWRIRHFVGQQTINEDPRLAENIVMADKASQACKTLLSLHVFRCTHVELLKKKVWAKLKWQ